MLCVAFHYLADQLSFYRESSSFYVSICNTVHQNLTQATANVGHFMFLVVIICTRIRDIAIMTKPPQAIPAGMSARMSQSAIRYMY